MATQPTTIQLVMARFRLPLFSLLTAMLFVLAVTLSGPAHERSSVYINDRVVITAPVQVLLMAGDRFLAANMETIRLAATGLEINPQTGMTDGRYLLRAHRTISELNPCHEDNYYLANALLAWGGAENEANEVLQRAIACRSWDFLPPFLYGFNQYFFDRNLAEAQDAFETAALRSQENAIQLRRLAIMIEAEGMDDEVMALNYLRRQRDDAVDAGLRDMLAKRVLRLEGLIALRRAQAEYEERFSRPLSSPHELLSSGIIEDFPPDPLGLGYEFDNGDFHMRQLKIPGLEPR
ncbi:MAG: hypothetical protein R6X15_03110 [Pseudomonadota bacterium]